MQIRKGFEVINNQGRCRKHVGTMWAKDVVYTIVCEERVNFINYKQSYKKHLIRVYWTEEKVNKHKIYNIDKSFMDDKTITFAIAEKTLEILGETHEVLQE